MDAKHTFVIATISAFAPIIHDKIVMNATEIPFLVSQARFYSCRQPQAGCRRVASSTRPNLFLSQTDLFNNWLPARNFVEMAAPESTSSWSRIRTWQL
jgi:hypothetical protein